MAPNEKGFVNILIKSEVKADFDYVVDCFNIELFKALKPPLISLDVTRFDGCKKGDEVHLEIGLGPLKQQWVSLITADGKTKDEWFFIDEGHILPPPLASWKHKHRVIKLSENKTLIVDDIQYSSGSKPLDFIIYPAMYLQFWLRKPAYKKFFKKGK